MWLIIGAMETDIELGRRIKALRERLNESQALFGERLGVAQVSVSRWESGNVPKRAFWGKIAEAAGTSIQEFFYGVPATDDGTQDSNERKNVRIIPVRGSAAAGVWMEHDNFVEYANEFVPGPIEKYRSTEQFAYKISGPSFDKLHVHDGDFVICVPYWEVRSRIEHGDKVVVERRRGGLIERTCKQIVVTKDGYELWPRSNDPRFQTPFKIPNTPPDPANDEQIEVVGLIIGRYALMV